MTTDTHSGPPADPTDTPPPDSGAGRRRALGLVAAGLGVFAAGQALDRTPAHADDPNDADKTLSNLSDYPAARANLTVGLVRTPEQFGAVGDGTTDDSAAIQAALDWISSHGGGGLFFAAPKYLIGSTVLLRQGVSLHSGQHHRTLTGLDGGTILQAGPGLTGWMFDTTSDAWKLGLAVIGFNLIGPGAHWPTAVGGIRLRMTYGARLQWLQMNSFSDSCIRIVNPSVAVSVEDCGVQTDSSGRTLTSVCAAFDLTGTDHYVRSIQCNGGPSDTSGTAGNLAVTHPGTFYRAAAHIGARGAWIHDLNGEFGDVGIYVSNLCQWTKFMGSRADVTAAHGWYVNGAAGNQFVGCSTFDAGMADDDSYDGVIHVNGAQRNAWTNYLYTAVRAPMGARYAWNDATTGISRIAQNTVDLPNCSVQRVTRDLVNTSTPIRHSLLPAGSGTTYERPPSRQMAGASWYDTTNARITFSTGQAWTDGTGTVVGNLMGVDQAVGRDGQKWAAFDSKSTVTALFTSTAPVVVFNAFNQASLSRAAATSAAVAGGTFFINGTTTWPVVAGQSYTVGCRTMAAAQPATVDICVNWYTAANAYLSTTFTSGGGPNSTTGAVTAVRSGFVAPSGAARAQILVQFTRSGLAAGDQYYVGHAFAVTGVATDYVEP